MERQRLNPDPGGQFASDAHRRVAGNLSVPRSIEDLRKVLADDTSFPDLVPGELELIVKDLAGDGHVKSLGAHDDADELVKAIKSDDDVPTLHKDKAKHFVLRTRRRGFGRPAHVVAGEQHYFTNAGLETLQAGLPDEPAPLEGEALRAAEEQDERLLAEVESKIKESNQ